MPFKSKAQARALHAKAARGEVSTRVVAEFDRTTKAAGGVKRLPERVRPKTRKGR